MIDKLEAIARRFDEVRIKLSDPDATQDMQSFTALSKEYKELETVVDAFDRYKAVLRAIDENTEILDTETDAELKDLAREDLAVKRAEQEGLEDELKRMLVPKDPEDDKNVMLEIRAGTGGDEAAIFAGDLYKMYMAYAESRGWSSEVMSLSEGTVGGFKEIVVNVRGETVYGVLKFESGVHRVQRVPKTESQGRVHTSAASVAVLPEVDEVDVSIDPSDLRIDTYRASGAGGQHVNKTESAVRITHEPTGVVVECQEGRSQLRNREIAMQWLRARLYEQAMADRNAEQAGRRKNLVSTGDRSAKIRTYNFPQGRVTDHRINLTLYDLDGVMKGDLDMVIDPLRMADQADRLAAMDAGQ